MMKLCVEGTETLTIRKRILKELQVEVSLNVSCYKHFPNGIYLCIIQGSSGAALHSRARQGRAGLCPLLSSSLAKVGKAAIAFVTSQGVDLQNRVFLATVV